MRLFALLFGLTLLACAMLAANTNKPLDRPLLIDEHSSGAWPRYAAAPDTDPQFLVAPCQLGPMNLPIVEPERKA
jgi:hypothetical protein